MSRKHVWIDLASAPQVQLYRPIIAALKSQGHRVTVTARNFLETTQLASLYQLPIQVIGEHGGKTLFGKFSKILYRTLRLAWLAKREKFDVALGHNSHAQSLAAGLLGIPLTVMLDYEHQPAHYLSLRFAHQVLVPDSVDVDQLFKFGIPGNKISKYPGIKEDIYLADFVPNPNFRNHLGIKQDDILIVMRSPGTMATYHRFSNPLFDEALDYVSKQNKVKVLFFPRTEDQAETIRKWNRSNIMIPNTVLDGRNAVYWADLVLGAGGTMNREAAALGTPAYTLFAGKMGGVDKELMKQGRLTQISESSDFSRIQIQPKKTWQEKFGNERLISLIIAKTLHKETHETHS